ncbi:hypothetical protein C8R43DRAFT_1034442 [Mycena crocata]|nr:hypothetical protein C8R43DRAFT_1034442 [Mycena crocata]
MVTVTGGDRDVWRCPSQASEPEVYSITSYTLSSSTCSAYSSRLAPPLPPMPSAAIQPSPSSRCPAPQSLIHFPFSTQALHYGTHGRTRNRRKCVPHQTHLPRSSSHSESPRHHKRVKYDTNARRHQPRQPVRTRPARSLHLRPPVTTHSHSGRRGTRLSRADGW